MGYGGGESREFQNSCAWNPWGLSLTETDLNLLSSFDQWTNGRAGGDSWKELSLHGTSVFIKLKGRAHLAGKSENFSSEIWTDSDGIFGFGRDFMGVRYPPPVDRFAKTPRK